MRIALPQLRPLAIALAALAASAAPAAGQTPAPSPPPAQPRTPTEAEIRESAAAIREIDTDRLLSDRDYAAQILAHLDLIEARLDDIAGLGVNVDAIRLFALMTLERPDAIRPIIDRLMQQRPTNPRLYSAPFFAALSIRDMERVATVVETASLNVRGVGWSQLRALLERDTVWPVLHQLKRENRPAQVRLAGALLRIGWTGGSDSASDSLRMILLEDALRRADREAARSFAAGMTNPATLAPLLILRRYDGLLPERADRLAPLREAVTAQERLTAENVSRDPRNLKYVLDRVQHLRALGRNAEALALAQPQMRDPDAAALGGEEGMWLVNEAAYALLDLGRPAEAARLLGGLANLPVAEHGYLISSIINQGEILAQAGLHAESLAHGRLIERDFAQHSSDYGDMWIRATIVCALASLGRASEAAPTLEAMRAAQADNQAALMRSYLCLNDLDAAERLIVSRLESDDPDEAVMGLQDYALEPRRDALVERLLAIRARPAVRAALERVARLVELPLARTYWGGF